MRRHKRNGPQPGDVSRYHARLASLFTVKKCTVFLLLMAAALAMPVWFGWTSYKVVKATDVQLRYAAQIEGPILYQDEVLTMSARMAAATGNIGWADRYAQCDRRIRPEAEKLWDLPQDGPVGQEGILTTFAADKLSEMETEILDLVRQGKLADATAMLDSQKYEDQKKEYARGGKAFVANLNAALEQRRDKYLSHIRSALLTGGVILPSVTFIWLIVLVAVGRVHARVEKKRKTSAYAREWQDTFNAISDGVCIIDGAGGTVVQCNRAMTRLLNRPYAEIVGGSCCELLHGSAQPVENCPLTRMFETRRSETSEFTANDRWFSVKVDPLIDSKGDLVGAVHILSDVTEQREATRAMRESEKKFRLAFANAQDAIVWIEAQSGIITHCNKSAEDLFGRLRRDLVGQHHTILYPPDKAEQYHHLIAGCIDGANNHVEAEVVRGPDIRNVTIAVSTMPVDGREIVQGIIRDVTESRKAIEEIESLARFPSEDPNPVLRMSLDGGILYANDASRPVLDAWSAEKGGNAPDLWRSRIEQVYRSGGGATYEFECEDGPTYLITLQPVVGSEYVNAYGLDITGRKKAEDAKIALELQLGQKQKMEAVGTLAGGIAHDFNNILAAMQGYVELSLDDLAEDHPIRDHLEQIMSCTNRAAKLVKQILTFSRKDESEQEKEPLQISSIVKEVLGMLRSSLPRTIKISRRIRAESSMVLADPTQMHQILVNLCTNASHAMRDDGGRLEVSLSDVDLDCETRVGDELLEPGRYVRLSVADSGCGMSEDVVSRIFEPFFTTKSVNEGTGLGLSVVHGIIKSHDGAIGVSSKPGEGTTFEIYLPRLEAAADEGSQPREPAARDKHVILLVDDEEIMVDVTRQTLERLGYEVVGKTNSVDALEIFQEEPERFDLVITDQVMPNMMGAELAENILSVRPEIPVILCSGFPETISQDQLDAAGIKKFVPKPISRDQLSTIVREALEANHATA